MPLNTSRTLRTASHPLIRLIPMRVRTETNRTHMCLSVRTAFLGREGGFAFDGSYPGHDALERRDSPLFEKTVRPSGSDQA